MSLNDPLANVLSQIKNYEKLGKREITTLCNSSIIRRVLSIMNAHGYIGAVEETNDSKGNYLKINLLGKINDTGVIKPRFQVKKDGFVKYEKRFLPAKDFGIIVVSTSLGIMTHKEAKDKGIGGKLISFVY